MSLGHQGLVTFKTVDPNAGLASALARDPAEIIVELTAAKLKG